VRVREEEGGEALPERRRAGNKRNVDLLCN